MGFRDFSFSLINEISLNLPDRSATVIIPHINGRTTYTITGITTMGIIKHESGGHEDDDPTDYIVSFNCDEVKEEKHDKA